MLSLLTPLQIAGEVAFFNMIQLCHESHIKSYKVLNSKCSIFIVKDPIRLKIYERFHIFISLNCYLFDKKKTSLNITDATTFVNYQKRLSGRF